MKKYLSYCIFAIAFLPLCIFAAPKTTKLKLLFVVHAPVGQIIQQNNLMTLVLQPAPKTIHYFTDRPTRKAGVITLSQFLKSWNQGEDSFKKDHPNAALIGALDATKSNHHIDNFIILSQPIHHEKVNSLTFIIKRIGPEKVKPQVIHNVVLFVDDTDIADSVSRAIYFNAVQDSSDPSVEPLPVPSDNNNDNGHHDEEPVSNTGTASVKPI